MMNDIFTIVWKEYKELFYQRPNLRGGWVGLLVFIGVFGILLPLQMGAGWVTSPINLIYWAWVPFMMVSSIIADSFAGERERHTLETLLASRLSDQSILVGKLLAAVLYGWGLTVFSLLLGLVTVNIAYSQGQLLFFPAWLLLSILAVSLLISVFSAGLGVLVSLRAATVRQAQQTLSIAVFVPLLPIFALPLLPASVRLSIAAWASTASINTVFLVALALVLVLDLGLLAACRVRFQRSKLILD